MTDVFWTQFTTLLTVVGTGAATYGAQIYREARNRRWEKEDRERIAQELTYKMERGHGEITDKMDAEQVTAQDFRTRTTAAIQSVHEAADSAYTEANHVNNKISDLNEQILRKLS